MGLFSSNKSTTVVNTTNQVATTVDVDVANNPEILNYLDASPLALPLDRLAKAVDGYKGAATEAANRTAIALGGGLIAAALIGAAAFLFRRELSQLRLDVRA